MTARRIGVLGATGLVGDYLLPQLADAKWEVIAFSRRAVKGENGRVKWLKLQDPPVTPAADSAIENWVSLAPIYALPAYLPLFETSGARRVVALSSTSIFSKESSPTRAERELAQRLVEGEQGLIHWAEDRGVKWVILRPTLIYRLGRDRNISEIARFIRRFKFFPLLGAAKGLRQPLHAQDVAQVCFAALTSGHIANRTYNIAGGEILSYREMVARIFAALGMRPRFLPVPLAFYRFVLAMLGVLPRYRGWSPAMAERMNRDLVFDYSDAARDINFAPRAFELSKADFAP